MITIEQKKKIQDSVGSLIRIENRNHADLLEGVTFNFAGKLEDDEGDGFYVRVGEDYMAGAMGVSFRFQDVYEIGKQIYGELRIILK